MGSRRIDRRPRWRRQLTLGLAVAVLVVAAGVGAWYVYDVVGPGPDRVTVRVTGAGADDHVVTIDGGASVGDAIVRAGIRPHDGRLLSVRDGAVLDPHADPARVTVDGRPASVAFPLTDGLRITVADGVDRREGTEVVREPLPAPDLPEVLRHVHHDGRDGLVERTVGERSREVVDSRVLEQPVAPRQTERRVVALTFDDGPSPTWTSQVQFVLDLRGVKATFCQLGEQVGKHPELTRQVAEAGHQLCNHTVHHPSLAGASAEELDAEIGGGAAAITDLGLDPPRYFRPPNGSVDDAVIDRARQEGEAVLGWSIDVSDWAADAEAATIVDGILAELEPGSIVLLHDGGGRTRQQTILATVFLLEALDQRGYELTFPLLPPEG